MRSYESVCLFAPTATEADVDKWMEKFTGAVTAKGGTVGRIDRQGLKRLAVAVGRHTEAWTVVWYFDAPANAIAEVTRSYGLSDLVIRSMVTHKIVLPPPPPAPPAPVPVEAPSGS
jgi:small subunit ribosomal protein S6